MNKTHIGIGLAAIFIYMLPYFLYGSDIQMIAPETLDSVVVWFKTLVESGKIFADSNELIPQFMNVPRRSFYSEFYLVLWLHYFLGTFNAIVVNEIIVRLIAFFGMYLLLKSTVLKAPSETTFCLLISIVFALIKVSHIWAASYAGIPFVLHALNRMYNNESNVTDWIIICIYPFYTNFHSIGIFFFISLFILIVYNFYTKKAVHKTILIAFITLVIISLLVNYRMVETFFFNDTYLSHRVERDHMHSGFLPSLKRAFFYFIYGKGLSIFHLYLVLPIVLFIMIKFKHKILFKIVICIGLMSLLSGFYFSKYNFFKSISFFQMFDFSRLMIIVGLVWIYALIITIKKMQDFKYGRQIVIGILVLQTLIMFNQNIYYQLFNSQKVKISTYKEYYAEDLFAQIGDYIPEQKQDYRVVSLGILPAVARYNGFYCLDGYITNYPLNYKKDFRQVMENELLKNQRILRSFDENGNRCYLFSSEIEYENYNLRHRINHADINPIQNLDINISKLKKLGCDYIFSAAIINNASDLNITLLNSFSDLNLTVYVYQL